jgi:anti-sigma B factor antagonist
MELYVENVGGITIASLVGELDGQTAPGAQDGILALVAPRVAIILDMTGLEYMSSAGARALLQIYRGITAQQGDVVLAGLNDEIADMLDATGFLNYFDVAATVDDALALFG